MTSENVPTPAAIYASMYPATVLLPGGVQHNRCKVFVAPEGLYVYWATPTSGHVPDWFAPVDYGQTLRMPSGHPAKLGWDVVTSMGMVTVTAEGGCGCGWPLKRWVPEFAHRRVAWPRPQKQSQRVTKEDQTREIHGARLPS